MDSESLVKRLVERIGQTVLTCPTASCFDGLPGLADRVPAGRALRVFGDRLQVSKIVGGERYWRVPVIEGECLLQESFGVQKQGVGGGNFLILAESGDAALAAAEAAVAAINGTPGVILPFPGGVARSGSKVGARGYKTLAASTNDAYCPTVRPMVDTALPSGIDAACRPGVRAITAGNYGGKLGPHHFHLREIMAGERS
jgi:formylmethanofuran--tetrahydromethanopterin N-formyltransferase